VATAASGKILVVFRSRLLVSSPIAISRSSFQHSSPIDGSGVLAIDDAVGTSTRRAGTVAFWITFVEDTTSTYDFHATHGKTSLCKIGFVCLLDYFTFLTHSFTCLSRWLRITTRQWAWI
jgi:hypothetical protein